MPQLLRSGRSYDHRIREIVCQTGNSRIFHRLRIPRSTTASWLSRGCRSVVSLDWHHDIASVLDENEKIERRPDITLGSEPRKNSSSMLDQAAPALIQRNLPPSR